LKRIDEVIRREMERGKLVGLAIALVKGSEIVWSQGYGYADLESKQAVTPDTVFSAQSVTKPVVATALMQWFERGRFKLDDPVNHHLAPVRLQNEFEDKLPVTIRQLLTHTAGLPVISAAPPPLAGPRSLEDHIATIVKSARPPGDEIVYANWGYDTIGYLVGRFAGKPYDEYLREALLDPLGMRASAIGGAVEGAPSAKGHFLSAVDGNHYAVEPTPWLVVPPPPSGSLFSTVEDLGRFLIAHLNHGLCENGRILSSDAVAEMHRVHAPAGPSSGGMGLGFAVTRANGRYLICHGGDGLGYTAFIGAHPAEKVGVAILINMSNVQTARSVIASTALRLLVGDDDVAPTQDREPPIEEWARITGLYKSTYWDIEGQVTVQDGSPIVHIYHGLLVGPGGANSRLERLGDGVYRALDGMFDGFDLTFEFGDDGKAARFYGGVYPFQFERQGDVAPVAEPVVDETVNLVGRWVGTVASPLGPLPVSLAVTDGSAATVTALSAREAAVEEFSAANGRVSGSFDVTVPGFGDFRIFLRLSATAGKLRGHVHARAAFGEFPMSAEMARV
jgi:CubicO group peptidase (beta-lactamase class C family)